MVLDPHQLTQVNNVDFFPHDKEASREDKDSFGRLGTAMASVKRLGLSDVIISIQVLWLQWD